MCSLGADLPGEEGTFTGVWGRVVPEGTGRAEEGGGQRFPNPKAKSRAPSRLDHTHREDSVKGEGAGEGVFFFHNQQPDIYI